MNEQKSAWKKRKTYHGMTNTKLYWVWSAMMQRCHNPKNIWYHNYGAKGITVCERWHDFKNFFADMGERPEGLTLERKDGTKGYSKNNCCWATRTEQNNNRGNNILVQYQGQQMTLKQATNKAGMTYRMVHKRLKRGWSFERAISTPSKTV